MLILNTNDAASEAGQLTHELHGKFSQENNRCHQTVLNSAINGACSHAMGSENKTEALNIVNIAVKYQGQHS